MMIKLMPTEDVCILIEHKKEAKKGVLILEDRDTKLYEVVEGDNYEPGDIVCLSSYPQKIEIQGRVFYACKEENIICKVCEED